MTRIINLVCIIVGGIIALYSQAEEQQNTLVLIVGIVLLMCGLYRTSIHIPSKFEHEEEQTFVETESDDKNR